MTLRVGPALKHYSFVFVCHSRICACVFPVSCITLMDINITGTQPHGLPTPGVPKHQPFPHHAAKHPQKASLSHPRPASALQAPRPGHNHPGSPPPPLESQSTSPSPTMHQSTHTKGQPRAPTASIPTAGTTAWTQPPRAPRPHPLWAVGVAGCGWGRVGCSALKHYSCVHHSRICACVFPVSGITLMDFNITGTQPPRLPAPTPGVPKHQPFPHHAAKHP